MSADSIIYNDFRIGTVNVHTFQNPKTLSSNVAELVSILKPLDLDIIAVQEAKNNEELKNMCDLLSLPYLAFGESYASRTGNAIASRYPIITWSNHISKVRYNGGRRGMLQCQFGGNHLFARNRTFAVTHLDHLNEVDRLTQINEFAPCKQNVNVLLGDMNTLTKDDYSETYYNEIVAGRRAKSHWEMPRFELMELLTSAWDFQDCFRCANPTLKDQDVATCPYGTRIDYILFRPLATDKWLLKECFIVDTRQATDHQAVVATFKFQP